MQKKHGPLMVRLASKSLKRACLIFLFGLIFFPFHTSAAIVEVDVIHSQDRYPVGGSYPILFNLRISNLWYVHGTSEDGNELMPTSFSFQQYAGLEIERIAFPPPVKMTFEYMDEAIELFSGEIQVRAVLQINEKCTPSEVEIKGQLNYQACTSKYCMPPEQVPVLISLSVVPKGTKARLINQSVFKEKSTYPILNGHVSEWKEKTGFWLILLGIFVGGLALNLTPCIYPLIPITVSYFGGMSRDMRGRTLVHGSLYISGLAFTNSLLGLFASLSGGMMGSALQHPVVLIVVASILVALALAFFDLWKLNVPSKLTRLTSKNFSGYFGTFFMGLTLGTVAAPCLGPFILGLLTYVAQKGDPFLGFLYFFVLSIGMGLPLAILAIFSGGLKKLPVSGEWMVWVRKAFGWALVVMAGYMLLPLISEPSAKTALIAIIVCAAGLHLGWFERSNVPSPMFKFIKKGLGTTLLCGAAIYFLVATPRYEGVRWTGYDQGVLKDAATNNKPVILDFYADWCAPCRALDKKVFTDPQVVELSRNFVTIRIDLTKRHPKQKELIKRYEIKGVPTIVFLNRQGVVEKGLRIESFVNRNEILSRMKLLIKES